MRDAILHLQKVDSRLKKVIEQIGELKITVHNDPFLFLTSEIVGQLISSSTKKSIFDKLLKLCGGEINPSNILEHSVEELRSTGLSWAKSRYIHNLARQVNRHEIDFVKIEELPDEEAILALKSIKGIGNWTAKMYLIFFLQRQDVLPYEDGAFLQAYKWLYNTKIIKSESIARKCKKWRPYTSIGARYMYRALDTGLTKIPIKDFLS